MLYFSLLIVSQMENVTPATNDRMDEMMIYVLFLKGIGCMTRNIKYAINESIAIPPMTSKRRTSPAICNSPMDATRRALPAMEQKTQSGICIG
jgi:hypothetical protein